MPLHPPRRWIQFKLSTWFVLVAILAWAMWVLPTTSHEYYRESRPVDPVPLSELAKQLNFRILIIAGPYTHELWLDFHVVRRVTYPALALAAFVGWKAVWAIGQRVRTRKVGQQI